MICLVLKRAIVVPALFFLFGQSSVGQANIGPSDGRKIVVESIAISGTLSIDSVELSEITK
jgi:hypothetical protein